MGSIDKPNNMEKITIRAGNFLTADGGVTEAKNGPKQKQHKSKY